MVSRAAAEGVAAGSVELAPLTGDATALAVTESIAASSSRVATAWAPKISRCWMVWFAPVPTIDHGRLAERISSGTFVAVASTMAGRQLATAVPEVITTGTGVFEYFASPRARKAAERSSVRTCSRDRPARLASAKAKASGAERDPGHTTASRTPLRINSSTSTAPSNTAGEGAAAVCCGL